MLKELTANNARLGRKKEEKREGQNHSCLMTQVFSPRQIKGGFGNQPQPGAPGWGQQFPGQQMFQDPMANMAMQYGTSLAGQGKDIVNKNFEKYVSTSKLKYYFAVDTSYVGKKLLTLIFPFTKKDQPVAPRFDDNAPDFDGLCDVYFGVWVGFGNTRKLGMQASTALVWLIIELVAVMMSLHGDEYHGGGAKRSLYLVLSISLVQPLLMWWLTRHIVFA
ncbi:YIF1B-like protein [Mya arenaria]|uniref:Protein YIF1 n=1 Tax=Mya arenaria TaxID=6604 RepID=A0ABY7FDE4_MYAAR|nr:YIF1B-like protein [Mya arenaria]